MLDAIKNASPERIAEAFAAGFKAAYEATPQHGHAAALEVLTRAEPEPAPVVEPVEPPAAEVPPSAPAKK